MYGVTRCDAMVTAHYIHTHIYTYILTEEGGGVI